MGGKILVRSYNVGCGDCSYVRIPNGDDHFHILIDCGSKERIKSGVLSRAIGHMKEFLPKEDGKRRLDLIVVTHRHTDHINGFDPKLFKDIAIKNIWLSAAMNDGHKQGRRMRELHRLAGRTMRELVGAGAALSPQLQGMAAHYGVSNRNAVKALTKTLPQQNNIEPTYVHAGMTSDALGVEIENTRIRVLAPEQDIDHHYLGKELDERLRSVQESRGEGFSGPLSDNLLPTNISSGDFYTLKARLLSNGLAFATDDSAIQNNVSTVLLIEWGQRRLLFVGDAEWDNAYREGKKNSSWNVMWEQRREQLNQPLDFLKLGHHGSYNATPFAPEKAPDHQVNQMLEALLPLPEEGEEPTAQSVVSTMRKQYQTIPDGKLLVELGRRVKNKRNYLDEFLSGDSSFEPDKEILNYTVKGSKGGEKGWLDKPQPRRTDMESLGKGKKEMIEAVEYIDVEIEP